MKRPSLFRLYAFFALIAIVGLACGAPAQPTPTVFVPPTPIPQQPSPIPQQPSPVPQQPTPIPATPVSQQGSNSSGGWVTFTDQNDLFAIDIPGDWTYQHTVDETNGYYYVDTFTSPDGGAVVENIVYDDGQPFTGSDKSKFALFFLNNWYSSTGREGDIRISDDRIQQDGSERLIWTSKGGGYSGVSFLETRGTTTFLFLTLNWGNSYEDQYSETMDAVLSSYRIP